MSGHIHRAVCRRPLIWGLLIGSVLSAAFTFAALDRPEPVCVAEATPVQ